MAPILFKFIHSILDWTALTWSFGGFLKTFLEGSVDHVIYRDYIVNRRFFIYCSLATSPDRHLKAVCSIRQDRFIIIIIIIIILLLLI